MHRPLSIRQNKRYGDKAFTESAYNSENGQQLFFYTELMQYTESE
jgi:hypothetical protein